MFLVALLTAIPAWSTEPTGSFSNVKVDEFERLCKTGNPIILDVRTPKEFAVGHLPGATNVDLFASNFRKVIGTLDTNKTCLVYCAGGGRGAKACEGMANFPRLYNLTGGFQAWQKAKKAVEK